MKVYIVLGYYGEYDDSWTNIEKVYANKNDAEKFKKSEEAYIKKYSKPTLIDFYNDAVLKLDDEFYNTYPELLKDVISDKELKEKYNKNEDEIWDTYWDNSGKHTIVLFEHVKQLTNCNYSVKEIQNIFEFHEKYTNMYDLPVFIIEEKEVE